MMPAVAMTATAQDDAALVARLKAGDNDAYEQLVRTNGSRLLAVARRILRDEDAAADAVQESFVNAFRAMAHFDGQAQLSTWLHRIVVNTCLMRVRRRLRKPEQSLDALLPAFTADGHHTNRVTSWAEAADRRLERKEVKALVWAGLAQLPQASRDLIVMRDIEGLSTREAAAILGVTDNALKLRLHRARQALAGILRQHMTPTPANAPRARSVTTAATSTGTSAGPGTSRPGLSETPRASQPASYAPSASLLASL